MTDFPGLIQAVIDGDGDVAQKLTEQALAEDLSANEVLERGLIPGLQKVGDLFEKGQNFLPELVISGDAVSSALELLEPILSQGSGKQRGRFLIGTVQGDVHNLGKNIVIMMLRGNGWNVTDLGVDISPEEFCDAVADGDYHVLGLSSLLTMTMPYSARTIDMIKEAGLRDNVKIIVGGAPTTQQWADQIGADAWAKDGSAAARIAASLL